MTYKEYTASRRAIEKDIQVLESEYAGKRTNKPTCVGRFFGACTTHYNQDQRQQALDAATRCDGSIKASTD